MEKNHKFAEKKSDSLNPSAEESQMESLKTSKRQTEAALFESVELYQNLIEISPEAVVLLDLSGKIIMANEQTLVMHGVRDIKVLIGRDAYELLVESDRERAKQNVGKTLAQGSLKDIEYTLYRADRSTLEVEINSSVIHDETGRALAVLLTLKDITSRKKSENDLRESELKYRTLIENALSGVYVVQENKFRYVNPALCQMFGYSQEEIIDKIDPQMLTYPQDRPLVAEQVRRRLSREIEAVRYNFRGLRKDGSMVYCESLGRYIELDGQPAIIGTLLDVTERKKMEEQLNYRAAFKNLITVLSTKFINLEFKEIDQGINDALKAIGEFARVDRSYIFIINPNNQKMDNTHEWCAPGIESHIGRLKKIPLEKFPWFMGKILAKEIVYVPDLEKLPADAGLEKAEWQLENIGSLINVPLVSLQKVIGFVGFDSVGKSKEWEEDVIALLRIAGDMFSHILERGQMDRDIKTLNKELLRTNIRLKQLALRDTLTGLFNQKYFEEVINVEFERAKRNMLPLSVILLDIDYFKSINDVYGHDFGDLVLQELSQELVRMVRKYDTVIRYGGEEFLIITPEAGKEVAQILAQRLLDVIKLHKFGDKQHQVKLKLSVAVASFPEDKIGRSSDFIKVTDFVLNRVKEMGGDRVFTLQDLKKMRPGKEPVPGVEEEQVDVSEMKEKLEKLTRRANQSLAEAIFAFAKTIEIRDHYTGEHVEKTVNMAVRLAKAKGLSGEEIERIKQAAILHDLGKIGITEKILRKKGKLTPREYEEIKVHPQIAADILRPIHFFHDIIPYILHHHERWDGKGYPHKLKGENIPLGARIIALADTFEALTSNRSYRKGCSKAIAVGKIKKVSGSQFDPELVELFLKIVKEEEV